MQEKKKKDVLSLSQAAKLADCSRDTIRRAAQRQELPARMGPGKRGPQWWVREADLVDWLQDRGSLNPEGAEQAQQSSASEAQQDQHAPQAEQSTAKQAQQRIEDADFAVQSTAKQARHEEHSSESSARQDEHAELSSASEAQQAEHLDEDDSEVIDFDSNVVSADIHKAVIGELVDELRRSDRQVIALQLQLSQNKNLLAEKTDSLLKQQAEERAKELLAKELEEEKEKHAEQAEQAQQELQQAQQEIEKVRAEAKKAAEDLKEARREIDSWEEQRKRPWWKKVFKTG